MMVPAALTVTVAGTSAAAPAARRLKEAVVTVAGLMARLNVALTVVFRGIPIEFGVGVCSVTVGRVAMVNVKMAGALTLVARSVAITLKVYTPSGFAGKVIGEVHGAKASTPVESEHWKVTGVLFAVKLNEGVFTVVTIGGVAVRVTTGGTVSIVNVNVAGRLGFRPASKATTVKVKVPSSCGGKRNGAAQGPNRGTGGSDSEHRKGGPVFVVNAKGGVLMFVGVGG